MTNKKFILGLEGIEFISFPGSGGAAEFLSCITGITALGAVKNLFSSSHSIYNNNIEHKERCIEL